MNKFKELRKLNHITQTQLSSFMHLNQATICKWELGKSFPDYETLIELAKFYGVTTDYLLSDEKESTNIKESKMGLRIPVLDVIPTEIPIASIEDIIEYKKVSFNLAKDGQYFALKVKGDSMSPKIEENDILIVKQLEDINNNDIGVVIVGNEGTVKRIKKDCNGIWLIPYNPVGHEAEFFSNEEIITKPIKIIGKAVEVRKTL